MISKLLIYFNVRQKFEAIQCDYELFSKPSDMQWTYLLTSYHYLVFSVHSGSLIGIIISPLDLWSPHFVLGP